MSWIAAQLCKTFFHYAQFFFKPNVFFKDDLSTKVGLVASIICKNKEAPIRKLNMIPLSLLTILKLK